jgi:putative tryptophan/tyrosine transport system substrate-binding protein
MLTVALEPKRLQLIHELVPSAAVVGIIIDPHSPDTGTLMKELVAAASALGLQIKTFTVSGGQNEIDAAFAAMADQQIRAAVVSSSPAYLRVKDLLRSPRALRFPRYITCAPLPKPAA